MNSLFDKGFQHDALRDALLSYRQAGDFYFGLAQRSFFCPTESEDAIGMPQTKLFSGLAGYL